MTTIKSRVTVYATPGSGDDDRTYTDMAQAVDQESYPQGFWREGNLYSAERTNPGILKVVSADGEISREQFESLADERAAK